MYVHIDWISLGSVRRHHKDIINEWNRRRCLKINDTRILENRNFCYFELESKERLRFHRSRFCSLISGKHAICSTIWDRYPVNRVAFGIDIFSDTCTKTIHVIFPVRTFIPSAHVPVPDDIDPKYGKITPAWINFCFFFYTFNSHEWPRQNFSLQYQYNIKQTSDENIEKFQLTDY